MCEKEEKDSDRRTKRENDDCSLDETGEEARRKEGIMSSAFAQPLTGFIYESFVYICAESPPVTLSRRLRNLIKALRDHERKRDSFERLRF